MFPIKSMGVFISLSYWLGNVDLVHGDGATRPSIISTLAVDITKSKPLRSGFRFHQSIIDVREESNKKKAKVELDLVIRQLYSRREDDKLQNRILSSVLEGDYNNHDEIILLQRSLLRTRRYDFAIRVFRLMPSIFINNRQIILGVILAYSMIGKYSEMYSLMDAVELKYGENAVDLRVFQAMIVADADENLLNKYADRMMAVDPIDGAYHLMRGAYNGGNYEYCVRIGENQDADVRMTLLLCRALERIGQGEKARERYRNINIDEQSIVLVQQIVNVGIQIEAFDDLKAWVQAGGLDGTYARFVSAIMQGEVEDAIQAFEEVVTSEIPVDQFQILKCIRISTDFHSTFIRMFNITQNEPVSLGTIAKYSVLYGYEDIGRSAFELLASKYLCAPNDKLIATSFFDNIWNTSRLDYIEWALEILTYTARYGSVEQEFAERTCKMARCTGWTPGEEHSILKKEYLAEVKVFESILGRHGRTEPLYSPNPNLVMVVNNSFRIGGAERQVVRCLKAEGHQSIAVVHNKQINTPENSFIEIVNEMGVEIFDYSKSFRLDLQSLKEALEEHFPLLPDSPTLNPHLTTKVRALCSIILQKRPAVIHLWQDTTNIFGAIAGLLCGVPRIIINARSVPPFALPESDFPDKGPKYYFNNRFVRESYRLVLSFPTVELCHNSEQGIKDYANWLSIEPDRIKLLRNGFDFKESSAIRCRMHNVLPIVGTVFRFVEVKRPELWIRTAFELHRLMQGKVRFVLAGDGPLMSKTIRLADELGFGPSIDFIGYHGDVLNLLNSFDIFLLTSSVEGLPNVVIEAQSMGVPVVSTDAGGAREAFKDGITGRLVKQAEPLVLAKTLYQCLDNPEWMEVARREAVEYCEANFNLELMYDSLADILWGDR